MTRSGYEKAMKRIEALMGFEGESEELDDLVTGVMDYEQKHFPIGPPTPIEAIKFRMDQVGCGEKPSAGSANDCG